MHGVPPVRLTVAIGLELRRRRTQARLSQAAVGSPFTRAFVCAVERGRAVPSIQALALMLDHLDVDLDEFFSGVQSQMTVMYTAGHAEHPEAPSRGRR
jgi:transcriptional regulator with XRE-family HTH domain